MADGLREAIAGAEAYEALHVPALFGEWAPRVLDAAGVGAGHRVLDVACGTGVLARAAARRVGVDGRTVGVDPNPGMLVVAERLDDTIEWRQGPAEELPLVDGSFDRVVSQFGMTFFSDPVRAVEEMLRVLVPDGRLAIAVWDALEASPAYTVLVRLLDRRAGTPAGDALRAPFAMGDRTQVEGMVRRAGAVEVSGTTVVGRARFPDLRSMVEADLRGWLPVMGVELDEERIQELLREAERDLSGFVAADGRLEFDAPAHIVSARKSG